MKVQSYEDIDLCIEIESAMRKMEFAPSSIEVVTNHEGYQEALRVNKAIQRTQLTMVFYDILVSSKTGEIVPGKIRMALNYSPDITGWLDDMKLVILPFLKNNEENFF